MDTSSVTTQLDDGIRMLQMQAHNQNGDIRLCHTSCVRIRVPSSGKEGDYSLKEQTLYDGGTLADYLRQGE